MNDYIKKQDVKDLIECNKDQVWKSGYINGYNKSQKEAYEKGKEVGKEEMYRQMTGTLAQEEN